MSKHDGRAKRDSCGSADLGHTHFSYGFKLVSPINDVHHFTPTVAGRSSFPMIDLSIPQIRCDKEAEKAPSPSTKARCHLFSCQLVEESTVDVKIDRALTFPRKGEHINKHLSLRLGKLSQPAFCIRPSSIAESSAASRALSSVPLDSLLTTTSAIRDLATPSSR